MRPTTKNPKEFVFAEWRACNAGSKKTGAKAGANEANKGKWTIGIEKTDSACKLEYFSKDTEQETGMRIAVRLSRKNRCNHETEMPAMQCQEMKCL